MFEVKTTASSHQYMGTKAQADGTNISLPEEKATNFARNVSECLFSQYPLFSVAVSEAE
ncbi:hypothetical protein ACFO3G_05125 [Falsiporphyromonas endometrii]|uniref:Uncharacterized protein n=1 Tax=Falsiporphyromonas endometrii TaxID=1387297 RepID=A0ABV9K713_9PORP